MLVISFGNSDSYVSKPFVALFLYTWGHDAYMLWTLSRTPHIHWWYLFYQGYQDFVAEFPIIFVQVNSVLCKMFMWKWEKLQNG